MDCMGGTVECRSELGEGATFVICFASVPLAEIMLPEGRTAPEAAKQVSP
jgi:hypothetical protein